MEEPQRAEGSAGAGRSGAGRDDVRWDALGPAVAAKLEPAVETLVDDVFASIARRDVPREWIVGSPNARHGVEHGVRGLLALIERGPHGQLPGRGLYFGFGRVQLRAGRSLGALLAAYHHAARATWDAIAHEGDGAALPQETLHALGDAILTCLAEISAASAEGFAFEQAALSPGSADHRHQLVAALVRSPPAPPAELRALARAAGWPAPPSVGAIVFDGERAGRLAARLPAGALVARVDGLGYALVPDPDAPGCVAGLRARLHDVHAALGPAVELERAAESARWARLALALGRDRPPALVVAADHRVDLLLLAEPAQELHVHAQTVRYRVGRLRALLGARIDGAEGRLELELALRVRGIGSAPRAAAPTPSSSR